MTNLVEDLFLSLKVTKMKKKVRELLAPSLAPTNLFTTPA
jgi:hypothetical protein